MPETDKEQRSARVKDPMVCVRYDNGCVGK